MDPSSTVCQQLCLEVVVVPQEAMVVVLCCESLPSRPVLLGPLHHQSVSHPTSSCGASVIEPYQTVCNPSPPTFPLMLYHQDIHLSPSLHENTFTVTRNLKIPNPVTINSFLGI